MSPPSPSYSKAPKDSIFQGKEETSMTSKRACSKILLCSAFGLLASAIAVAQTQPGGGVGQPNMANQ
jgi:hypothetical protein